MRSYRYSYQTIVRYSSTVSHHHFLLRCTPREDGHQHIVESDLNLLTPTNISRSIDAFGNTIHYGSMINRHDLFVVASSGIVKCESYRIEESQPNRIFLAETSMTVCNSAMRRFLDEIKCNNNILDCALALADSVYQHMSYAPGVTNTQTTAIESFRLGVGVCQDFAHILIAVCRSRGIFARYVAGFVIGTGETHAWVEVYDSNLGAWYGIDPTHNKLIEDGYIKLAHGRDASDCSVVRGVCRGAATHDTEIKVVLEPII